MSKVRSLDCAFLLKGFMRAIHSGVLTWIIFATACSHLASGGAPDLGLVKTTNSTAPIRFVSQSALSSASLDELPLQASCREDLRSGLVAVGAREVFVRYRFHEPPPPDESAVSMQEFLQGFPIVLVARVANVEAGWDCHYHTVARRIDLEVEEQVKGEADPLARVTLIEPGGALVLDGKECNWGESKVEPALQAGVQVLVAGYPGAESEPRTFHGHVRFRILDEQVEPISALQLRERVRVDLRKLLATLKEDP